MTSSQKNPPPQDTGPVPAEDLAHSLWRIYYAGMMVRTTIMLPSELRLRSTRRARQRGLSFGELVRESLAAELERGEGSAGAGDDPLFADRAVFRGRAPKDVAKEHDAYLYGDRE